MLDSRTRPSWNGALAMGGILIAVGSLAYGLRLAGVDFERWFGTSAWTMFIIGVGAALLLGALLTPRGDAQGLTIAGAVVTTVGLMLLYMNQTGHWESWAYAWALIPTAVGVALIVHGSRTGTRPLRTTGMRMVAIMLALLVAGWWYFETIFQTGQVPFDVGEAWPLAVVIIGGLVAVLGLIDRTRPTADPTATG